MPSYGQGKYFDEFTDRSGFSGNCYHGDHKNCAGTGIVKRTGELCTCDCHKLVNLKQIKDEVHNMIRDSRRDFKN